MEDKELYVTSFPLLSPHFIGLVWRKINVRFFHQSLAQIKMCTLNFRATLFYTFFYKGAKPYIFKFHILWSCCKTSFKFPPQQQECRASFLGRRDNLMLPDLWKDNLNFSLLDHQKNLTESTTSSWSRAWWFSFPRRLPLITNPLTDPSVYCALSRCMLFLPFL